MRETDGEIYEDEGSWDGDVLANIGVGFCQVQGEKPTDPPVLNEPWMKQGRRGTNPFNNKKLDKNKAFSTLKDERKKGVQRHEIKPAWIVESCMRNEKRKIGDSQGVIFKECANVSKTSKTGISPEKVERQLRS